MVADIYRGKLELDGYEVVVSTSRTAVPTALRVAPDIVFLNVLLPSSDGALVLERLRGEDLTRHVPVLVITDHNESELRRHGFDLSALDHVIDTSLLPDVSGGLRTRASLTVLPGAAPEGAVPAFSGGEGFEA